MLMTIMGTPAWLRACLVGAVVIFLSFVWQQLRGDKTKSFPDYFAMTLIFCIVAGLMIPFASILFVLISPVLSGVVSASSYLFFYGTLIVVALLVKYWQQKVNSSPSNVLIPVSIALAGAGLMLGTIGYFVHDQVDDLMVVGSVVESVGGAFLAGTAGLLGYIAIQFAGQLNA